MFEIRTDGKELKLLLDFLIAEFNRIFGDLMENEYCQIINDPKALTPMLITTSKPIKIRLAVKQLNYWCQVIYQLSHEMCHYVIRQGKEDKSFTLSWLEEIICEAMSLYILHYSAANWGNCLLSRRDIKYSRHLREYLEVELEKQISDNLKQCTSYEKLQKYEYEGNPENHREGHRGERNALYKAIRKDPLQCRVFCDYEKYLIAPTRLLVDFDHWEKENPAPMVKVLRSLQPVLN